MITDQQHKSMVHILQTTKAYEAPQRDREDIIMMIYVKDERRKLVQKVIIDPFGAIHYKNNRIIL